MTDRELMQMALDSLEGYARNCRCEGGGALCDAGKALRARLAQHEPPCKTGSQCVGGKCERCAVQPEPEPIAWINYFDGWSAPDDKTLDWHKDNNASRSIPLYAVPQRQPEPEPVAWWHDRGEVVDLNVSGRGTPLYFAPPQREWVGLTDEEIKGLVHLIDWTAGWTYGDFARTIEAKLKEKNGGG